MIRRCSSEAAKLFHPILSRYVVHRCVYCGEAGSARDHYRPWSVFGEPHWLRSCNACNVALGAKVNRTLGDRCATVADGLRRRHKRLLRINHERLMEGAEGRLRDALMADVARAERVRARIAWARTMASLTSRILLEGLHERRDDIEAIEEALDVMLTDLREWER